MSAPSRATRGVSGRRLVIVGVVVAMVTAGCTGGRAGGEPGNPPTETGAEFQPGGSGIGDPYYPGYGNGGYDVTHYDLEVTYDPDSDELTGAATITATATQDLSRFNLDLAGLTVQEVTVNGEPAQAERDGTELVVTPAAGVVSGAELAVAVSYQGVPEPESSDLLGSNGFHHTDDGAFAIGEPRSAVTWYPVNGHPSDKATYHLAITVPDGLAAVSNGVAGERSTEDGWTTWRWSVDSPMANYLSTLAVGDYRVDTSEHAGAPMVVAVHADLPSSVDDQLRRSGEIADQLAEWFGPYPFDSYGGIALADDRIGYALETQTRPIYGPGWFRAGRDATGVIVHELAHQWYGDSVAVSRWRDIWLNEGFATYAQWLWSEHAGGRTVAQRFDDAYTGQTGGFWSVPPGDPGPENLFHGAVYQRGGMALHALRIAVGDDAFFEILQTWAAEHADGNATTDEFIALAERVSGESLGDLFDEWLHTPEQPPHPAR